MNNNFTFNYQKQLEEQEKQEIVHKKYDDPNNNVVEEEKKEIPKNKSKRKYVVYLGLFIVLIVYALLSSPVVSSPNSNNSTPNNPNDNSIPNKEEENTINKDIFALLNKNDYTYQQQIIITKEEVSDTYLYSGTKTNQEISILKTIDDQSAEYTYRDDKYYQNDTEVLEEEVYDVVNKQYIDLNYIKDYINHAILYSTTIYKDGRIVKVYHLYIKEIIIGYKEEDFITIELIQSDNYSLNIDYTNIVKLIDEEIDEYLVSMEYNIIKDNTPVEP